MYIPIYKPLSSFIHGIRPGPRLLVYFRNRLIFYGEVLLAPPPTLNVKSCSRLGKEQFLYTGCSFCRLIKRPEHLIARHWHLPQTESHWFGDHLISESVCVAPSSVIVAYMVLCSVSLWLVSVDVQSACALNILYFPVHRSSNCWERP
jgi:hypothetical protein